MAQKTEKEETEFKVKETLTLCVNNCGVTGYPSTNNMCQKCFNATTSAAAAAEISKTSVSGEKSTRSISLRSPATDPPRKRPKREEDEEGSMAAEANREVNRCSGCRRKVGLTGFRCRCGDLFCWEHRYSDRHDCSFDYKAAGREAIARENPVVKAAKILRV